jgi:hypothetical protein
MFRSASRVIARVSVFAIAGVAATAVAAPATINTEQKAAAALMTSRSVAQNQSYYNALLLERTVFYTKLALQTASTVTTPAALMANPAGVVVPCQTSGSMTARMAPTFPRVFKFEWNACVYNVGSFPNSLDGPGEVVLLADNFTPKNVASIRFGALSRDLVQTTEISFPNFAAHLRTARNLRLTGVVPMTVSQFAVPNGSSPFLFVATGFIDDNTINEFPGTGQPPSEAGSRLEHEFVTYAGNLSYNEDATKYDEDVSVLAGKLTYTRRNPPPYGISSEVSRFDGLRVHTVTDFNSLTKTRTIDGKLDFTWDPNFGAGCVNGGYQFRTSTPLHGAAFSQPDQDSGDLTINGILRSTFYSPATVPPGLPVPTKGLLIHSELQGVGAFNYDANSVYEALRPVGNCG